MKVLIWKGNKSNNMCLLNLIKLAHAVINLCVHGTIMHACAALEQSEAVTARSEHLTYSSKGLHISYSPLPACVDRIVLYTFETLA